MAITRRGSIALCGNLSSPFFLRLSFPFSSFCSEILVANKKPATFSWGRSFGLPSTVVHFWCSAFFTLEDYAKNVAHHRVNGAPPWAPFSTAKPPPVRCRASCAKPGERRAKTNPTRAAKMFLHRFRTRRENPFKFATLNSTS